MAGPQDVVAKVEDTLAAAARCTTDETTQNYDALAQELQDLGEMARRSCEAHVDYRSLVRKLRAGTALSPDERATLRLLIVGDVAKIVSEIEGLKQSELSCDGLMHLSVLCREADTLLLLAQHYLDSRDRVRRFEASTQGALDSDSARTLATIVEDMVAQSQ